MAMSPLARTTLDAALATVLTLCALGLGLSVTEQVRWRVDLSASGEATLPPELEEALAAARAEGVPVEITAFSAQRRDERALERDRAMRDLLLEVELRDAPVQTRFVDFDAEPHEADALGVRAYGALVVQAGERRVDLTEREMFPIRRGAGGIERPFVGPLQLARAIQEVVARSPRVACFVSGHGERRPDREGPRSAAGLARRLSSDGWVVRTCDLLRSDSAGVPLDTSLVVLADPTAPLPASEAEALSSWLRDGGGLLVLLDTTSLVPGLVESIGLTVPRGEVRAERFHPPHPGQVVVTVLDHPAVSALVHDDLQPLVSGAVALESHPLPGAVLTPILVTGPEAWRAGTRTSGPSQRGRQTLGVAVELGLPHHLGAPTPARVAVLGDADVARVELLEQGAGNSALVVGLARWAARTDPPPPLSRARAPMRRLALDPAAQRRVQWGLIGGLPAFVLLLGGVVRRLRGRR